MGFFLAAGATPPFLAEVAALLVCGALIAYICYRFGLLPIIGFLVAGVVVGPNALGLVRDRALVDAVAEVGVLLLLFTIGIEFSLEKLARIRTLILGGGTLQVVLASVVTMGVLALIGVPAPVGLYTGFLVALSSTAIVLKVLADRGEASTTVGQVSLGLLIFQDLAIIVMVLLVPALAGRSGTSTELFVALGKAALIIAGVLVIARRLMPPLLERVARTCSAELFLLTVVAICFGTAYLTSLAGVSVSLGAFLAGLIVSESRFSQHAFSEIMPLQILFSATFFVSVGMLLDLGFVMRHLPAVVGAVLLVAAIKVATTAVSVLALGYRLPVATAAGLTLAQVGEFSFVLERAGRELGLSPAGMSEAGSQTFIATTVLLMMATPALTQLGSRFAARIEERRDAVERTHVEEAAPSHQLDLENHVIVAGYGDAARQLVRALHGCGIPYVITTLSPGGAAEAEAEGLPVLRGDASKLLTLLHAGIGRAKMVVIADDDPATAHRIAAVARPINPSARLVVRTRFVSEVEPLTQAGVDRVIAEELESIVQLFAEVMRDYDISAEEIESHEESIRQRGYATLRVATPPAVVAPLSRRSVDTSALVDLTVSHADGCSHVSEIRPVRPSASGCEECLRTGDTWVHLRLCMTCGHVGCCDSSRNKHATAHHHRTGHPIVRSLEPGERWGWCYADQTMLE
jgi:monovalent cation:H+ antiporter-2, CPA2 family